MCAKRWPIQQRWRTASTTSTCNVQRDVPSPGLLISHCVTVTVPWQRYGLDGRCTGRVWGPERPAGLPPDRLLCRYRWPRCQVWSYKPREGACGCSGVVRHGESGWCSASATASRSVKAPWSIVPTDSTRPIRPSRGAPRCPEIRMEHTNLTFIHLEGHTQHSTDCRPSRSRFSPDEVGLSVAEDLECQVSVSTRGGGSCPAWNRRNWAYTGVHRVH